MGRLLKTVVQTSAIAKEMEGSGELQGWSRIVHAVLVCTMDI